MARKRYSDEDCLRILRQVELDLAGGRGCCQSLPDGWDQRYGLLHLAQEVWWDGRTAADGVEGF